jgi:hypothetical protein
MSARFESSPRQVARQKRRQDLVAAQRRQNAMLVFVWFCVMMNAMAPSGENVARLYVNAIEDQYRAIIEGRNAFADEIADLRRAA